MRVVVTGAAGFIGSNLVRALNARGETRIIAVDDLTEGDKFRNLRDCSIEDYLDKQTFLQMIESGRFGATIDALLHQGACSDTMESDGRYMMENNYRYSLALLEWSQARATPFIYASSAAVYGESKSCTEGPGNELPLNVYGWSKLLFDQVVRRRLQTHPAAPIVGLRYFNVYGPGEAHKASMASVALHLFQQLRNDGCASLFEGSNGAAAGEQRRDFVWIGDVAAVNLHFLGSSGRSGIFNLGTGESHSFNDLAMSLINGCRRHAGQLPMALHEALAQKVLRYVPFPQRLLGKYQAFTCADIGSLRDAGFSAAMIGVEAGVARYLDQLMRGPT